MILLPKSLEAWETPDFDNTFKAELSPLGKALPLQENLTSGSFAVENTIEVMVISRASDTECIRVKAGLFYQSLMPGCACSGDPTVEDTQNEHVTVLVTIDRKSGETVFQSLEA